MPREQRGGWSIWGQGGVQEDNYNTYRIQTRVRITSLVMSLEEKYRCAGEGPTEEGEKVSEIR